MRLFVEIQKTDGRYSGVYYDESSPTRVKLEDPALGPEAEVEVNGQRRSLGELSQALIDHRQKELKTFFDASGQKQIGSYLYRQLFGDWYPETLPEGTPVEVRIVSEDEHLARLPWVLLARKGVLLSTEGWAVTLGRSIQVGDTVLPSPLRILYLDPEPSGLRATRAAFHRQALETILARYGERYTEEVQIRTADTWEKFTRAIEAHPPPHIVYYYGHGVGDKDGSSLVFVNLAGEPDERPVADVALALAGMEQPPVLAYVNCCSGDAGGFLGAGWQIGRVVPAVITNRTVAEIEAAQEQALALWESILLNGEPPHQALADMYSTLVGTRQSVGAVGWMTPVMHCRYGDWKSLAVPRADPLERDPDWELKLNRVEQFAVVKDTTEEMITSGDPRSWAYVWYGRQGRGVDAFCRRLNREFGPRRVQGIARCKVVFPAWPSHLHDPRQDFAEMISNTFQVRSMAEVESTIRAYAQGASAGQTLIYVQHKLHRWSAPRFALPGLGRKRNSSTRGMDPYSLEACKAYLEWWDQEFVPKLPSSAHAIVTLCFEVDKPKAFIKALTAHRLESLQLARTQTHLLKELPQIDEQDLRTFLARNVGLPHQVLDLEVPKILKQSRGDYIPTVHALRPLMS